MHTLTGLRQMSNVMESSHLLRKYLNGFVDIFKLHFAH